MLVLIADGLHNAVPEVSPLELAVGLTGRSQRSFSSFEPCDEAPDRSAAHRNAPLSYRKRFCFSAAVETGATGLEPATSGVTGRSWRLGAERRLAGITPVSRTF